MSTHRPRAYSPPRNPRASTGQVYVTSFDTSTSTQPGRNSVSNVSGRQNVIYEAQPIRKSHDGKKTEYAVRPRQDSAAGTENKRPLAISTKNDSPSRRGSTAVASPREPMSAGAIRDDSSRFLKPASSSAHRHGQHHARHNSTATADSDGYSNTARERRDKVYRTQAPSGQSSQKQYYSSRAQAPRHQDVDGWSYTGPREQFDRDYPDRSDARRDSQIRKERPVKAYERDRVPARREITGPPPPPPASRQLARIEKADTSRYVPRSSYDSDPDRSHEPPHRRQSLRAPVLHQQYQQRDDGYSSAREDNEPRGHLRARDDKYEEEPRRRERHRELNRDINQDRDHHREYDREPERDRPRDYDRSERQPDGRRKPRSRDPSPERSGLKGLAAGALGSLATAGTFGILRREGKDKEGEPDNEDNQEHRHRRRRRQRKTDELSEDSDGPDTRRSEDTRRTHAQDGSSSDTPEDQSMKRDRPRRRHREDVIDEEQRQDDDRERPRRRHRDEEVDPERMQENEREPRARSSSRARFRDIPPTDSEPSNRDLALANKPELQAHDLETRTLSPGENEDDRPRRVQLVEPVKDNQDIKPRGILKPARQVPFPEDPNPIREGVAPLKDATKDGVPPNARWTKINRVLVNPEALEKYNERFEEREDYVIVLRVLSREEIQKLAEKTKEIRETREHEWQLKLEERKRRKEAGNDEDTDYSASDEQQEKESPLAIEAGSTAPPLDLRNLQQEQQQQQHQQHVNQDHLQSIPIRSIPGGLPIADDDFDRNYSQNV